ncbi:unnamed protein product [Porites lobata]|uniref:Uncharacterized protein n=1 Tax=Porites lobata TaxID=104759 RepID=A0ABN8SC29_9CNID|nr:unnamed protein product [Porites lobata]
MEFQSAIWMCQVIFFRYCNNMQSDNLGYIATSYRSAYVSKVIQKEHDCAKQIPSFDENILKQTYLGETGDLWYSTLVPSKSNASNQKISIDHSIATISVCNENFFCLEKTQTFLYLLKESRDEFITITIPELKEVKLSSTNNHYIDMGQGTSVASNLCGSYHC